MSDFVTCLACGLTWDDSIPTSMTPAPSARCPFEYFHEYIGDEPIALEASDIPADFPVQPVSEGFIQPDGTVMAKKSAGGKRKTARKVNVPASSIVAGDAINTDATSNWTVEQVTRNGDEINFLMSPGYATLTFGPNDQVSKTEWESTEQSVRSGFRPTDEEINRSEVSSRISQGERVYTMWHDQIIKLRSEQELNDKYKDHVPVYWVGHATIEDLVSRATKYLGEAGNDQNGLAESNADTEADQDTMFPWEDTGEPGPVKHSKLTWIDLKRKANFNGGALARIVGQALPQANVSWEGLGGNVMGLVIEANGNTLYVSDVDGQVGIGSEDGEFFQNFAGLQFNENDLRDIADAVITVASSVLHVSVRRKITAIWNEGNDRTLAVVLNPDKAEEEQEDENPADSEGRVEVDVRHARRTSAGVMGGDFNDAGLGWQAEATEYGDYDIFLVDADSNIISVVEEVSPNDDFAAIAQDLYEQFQNGYVVDRGMVTFVGSKTANDIQAQLDALRARFDEKPELIAGADAAYDRQDQSWFNSQSLDDLKFLWEVNPMGMNASWDDEVYEALYAMGHFSSRKQADAANNPPDPEDVEVTDDNADEKAAYEDDNGWATKESNIDASVAHAILMEVMPGFAERTDGSAVISEFLGDFRDSGQTDMFAFAQEWVGEDDISAAFAKKQSARNPDGFSEDGNSFTCPNCGYFTDDEYELDWMDYHGQCFNCDYDFSAASDPAIQAEIDEFYASKMAAEMPGESQWVGDAWPHGGGTNRPQVENPVDMFDAQWVQRPEESESLQALAALDFQQLKAQIGTWNLLAISGGRMNWIDENTIKLPVSNGYAVEISLNVMDTYDVRRTYRGQVKKEWNGVYADQIGEIAYQASLFHEAALHTLPKAVAAETEDDEGIADEDIFI